MAMDILLACDPQYPHEVTFQKDIRLPQDREDCRPSRNSFPKQGQIFLRTFYPWFDVHLKKMP